MNGHAQRTGRLLLTVVLAMSGQATAASRLSEEVLPGTASRYTLATPADRTDDGPVPLVVSLHYGGPVTPWYGRGLLEDVVEPALRPLGAVMVAPDCPRQAWSECADAVARIIDRVQREQGTDPGCVILTGYSKGGIGTWALAARAPGRYAAAVVMAARVPPQVDLGAWQLPVRVIHAGADEIFPAADAVASVERLGGNGIDAAIEVLGDVTHYETHRFVAPLARQVDWLRHRCPGG